MKKILLSVLFAASLTFAQQSNAQCSGASVAITNFNVIPLTGQVIWGFDWKFVQGNASLQVQFWCNNTFLAQQPCIPRLKDSTAGNHHQQGIYIPAVNCNGVLSVRIVTWTNPDCGGDSCQVRRDVPGNIVAPVTFQGFTASRNHSVVSLKWQTVTESNNSGFAIERNTTGTWEQVGFVPTQAPNGVSADILNYSYSDVNNTKSISQYRIRQIDFDGMSKTSETRAVRGDGQSIRTVVYPNPSSDGKVNIVFEDGGSVSRDIAIADMSGRTVKVMKGVTNNNVTIDNLTPGIYSLRIVVPATGEQSVEKIVVNKR